MSFKGKTINLKVILYNSGKWLAIFMKHKLRFGLVLGQLAVLKVSAILLKFLRLIFKDIFMAKSNAKVSVH